jgi:ATP-dependent Clp protease ATP-binding subunit ClpB
MALDPQRWTVKTRDAFQAATTQAAAAGNPYVTPAHLLLALLNQADGIARPLLLAANVDPITTAAALNEKVAAEPRTVGGTQPGLSNESRQGLESADELRAELGDEYLSVDHIIVAWASLLGTNREALLSALRGIRGSARITSENP